jgi:hypothetical protein
VVIALRNLTNCATKKGGPRPPLNNPNPLFFLAITAHQAAEDSLNLDP